MIKRVLRIVERRTGQAPFLAGETLERFARAAVQKTHANRGREAVPA
jgi:hypothetical protein